MQAASEDLAVVNLLIEESASGAMPNIVAFSGQKPCLEMPGHMVVVNTYNVNPDGAVLACSTVTASSIHFGWDAEKQTGPWPTGAISVTANRDWSSGPTRTRPSSRLTTEALADLVLGKVDAFELTAAHTSQGRIGGRNQIGLPSSMQA